MKGMELPISTLVIIIVCIAVLLAVIMFFFGGYAQGSKAVNLETARSVACQKLASMNCDPNINPASIQVVDFDADKDGQTNNPGSGATGPCDTTSRGDNLAMLCVCYYGIAITGPADPVGNPKCKKQVCNCG